MSEPTNTTAGIKHIDTGPYYIDATCPRCGAVEPMLATIKATVTQPENDLGSLRVKLYSRAREHSCPEAVRIMRVDATTGEVTE